MEEAAEKQLKAVIHRCPSRARQQRLAVEHAKLERLVSEERELRHRLDSAKRQLLELTAELEGEVPDEARKRSLTVALKVSQVEVKDLQQRHRQTESYRASQEYILGPR